MGFARRAVRKSVRKATPRPIRQAMHPARTVKYAVTPRPVRQVSRAAYTIRNPLGAAENKLIGAALNGGTSRRGGLSFWLDVWRRRPLPGAPVMAPVNQVTTTQSTSSSLQRWPQAPTPAAPRHRQVPQRWPAMPEQTSGLSTAGDPELDVRRHVGLGDGSRIRSRPKAG